MEPAPPLPAATIVAPATPPGPGGIGVVRISGPGAFAAGRALFIPRRPFGARGPRPRFLHLGHLVEADGSLLDQALAAFFRAPASYTGEDLVELQAHGAPAVLQRVVELALGLGCRLAHPGEFTLRAWLNRKLDLTQAEAVAGLVSARGRAEARLALAALEGGLARRLAPLRQGLLAAAARVEAAIDFPEEAEAGPAGGVAGELDAAVAIPLAGLLAESRARRVYLEGATVALCGRPNVGKSSLFNALLGRERALVHPTPGTTRDVLEAWANLGGVACRLLDTAGLGAGTGELDALGMAAGRRALAGAGLRLLALDQSRPLEPADRELLAATRDAPRLLVLNKADLAPGPAAAQLAGEPGERLATSALTGRGIPELAEAVGRLLAGGRAEPAAGEVAAGVRQGEALARCLAATGRALAQLSAGEPAWELASLELSGALAALGEVDGQGAPEEVIAAVFSRFCVGK